MKSMFKNIHAFALAVIIALSAVSCVRENLEDVNKPAGKGEDGEGTDLMLAFSMEDLIPAAQVEPDTRSVFDGYTPEENVALSNMSSIVVFILKKTTGQVVAYRIISAPDKDSEDIWFLGKDPNDGEKTRTWSKRFNEYYMNGTNPAPFETNDHKYNDDPYYKDDQHYGCWIGDTKDLESDCVGYNGFARIAQNELVTNIYDGNVYPDFDRDGKYDDSYNSNPVPGESAEDMYKDAIDYEAGNRMRKSAAVILSFKYDNPMHGPVERLRRGDYYVVALANFRESISTIELYNPTQKFHREVGEHRFSDDYTYIDNVKSESTAEYNCEYIEDHIYALIRNWNPNTGIPYDKIRLILDSAVSLSEIRIKSGTDGDLIPADGGTGNWKDVTSLMRSKRARIISTGYQQLTLTPGNTNIYSLKLERSVARATFKVSNYSELPLTIKGFSLSNNFAQGATYLFNNNRDSRFRQDWQGSPDVTDADNIVAGQTVYGKPLTPFTERTEAKGNRIASYGSETIFDALMYESGGTSDMLSYNITVQYEGENKEILTGYTTYGYSSMTDYQDFNDLVDEKGVVYSLMTGRDGFMYYDTATETIKTDSRNWNNTTKDLYHLWKFVKIGDAGRMLIKNVGLDKYIVAPTSAGNNSFFGFSENAGEASIFTMTYNSGYTGIYPTTTLKNGNTVYMHSLQAAYQHKVCCADKWPEGNHYDMYIIPESSLTKDYEPIMTTANIPIEFFDMVTNISQPLYKLNRNHHLQVHLGVSYNKKYQDIEFHVQAWNEINNDITFD